MRKLSISADIFATSSHNLTCRLVCMSSQRWYSSVIRKHCSASYNWWWKVTTLDLFWAYLDITPVSWQYTYVALGTVGIKCKSKWKYLSFCHSFYSLYFTESSTNGNGTKYSRWARRSMVQRWNRWFPRKINGLPSQVKHILYSRHYNPLLITKALLNTNQYYWAQHI